MVNCYFIIRLKKKITFGGSLPSSMIRVSPFLIFSFSSVSSCKTSEREIFKIERETFHQFSKVNMCFEFVFPALLISSKTLAKKDLACYFQPIRSNNETDRDLACAPANARFPALCTFGLFSLAACFPALGTYVLFSRAWYRLKLYTSNSNSSNSYCFIVIGQM